MDTIRRHHMGIIIVRIVRVWECVRAQDHTSEVIGDIMDTIRRHQVALKGVVSTVVVTTLVLEGACAVHAL